MRLRLTIPIFQAISPVYSSCLSTEWCCSEALHGRFFLVESLSWGPKIPVYVSSVTMRGLMLWHQVDKSANLATLRLLSRFHHPLSRWSSTYTVSPFGERNLATRQSWQTGFSSQQREVCMAQSMAVFSMGADSPVVNLNSSPRTRLWQLNKLLRWRAIKKANKRLISGPLSPKNTKVLQQRRWRLNNSWQCRQSVLMQQFYKNNPITSSHSPPRSQHSYKAPGRHRLASKPHDSRLHSLLLERFVRKRKYSHSSITSYANLDNFVGVGENCF